MKVLSEEGKSKKRNDWEWINLSLSLPEILEENNTFASPGFRLDNIRGKLTPVLDLKVKVKEEDEKIGKNFVNKSSKTTEGGTR